MAKQKAQYMWPSHWGRPVAHGPYGAVSSNSIYATRAGLEMLRRGGNAFDAAAAVSLTLSVVEPHHSGIGGGCLSLIYSAKENRFSSVDGRGVAPQNATADLFLKDGVVQDEWKDLGGQSVAIPSLLKTLEILLEKYGTMTLAEVMQPAIHLAEEGFGVSYTGALTMYDDSVQRKLKLSAPMRELYLKEDGSYYRFGEVQKNPALAAFLRKVAENGTDYLYRGRVAEELVAQINARGGCFTTDDLANCHPKFREPLRSTYRDCEVVAFAPPSGGCAVVEMRKAQVPSIVLTAGYRECPRPRRTPAGISWRLQSGSNGRMHRMRTPALSITACSGVNSPEKKLRNQTMVRIGTELQTVDRTRQSRRTLLHRASCPAAWFWLVNVVAVCPKAVII